MLETIFSNIDSVIALVVALGPVGTALEAAGERFGWAWAKWLGHRLEATSIDLPKLWRGSRMSNAQDAAK